MRISRRKFMGIEFKSKARIIDDRTIEVQAPDGESYSVISSLGTYIDEEVQNYFLHMFEYIFDKCFSDDKERMANMIWRELMLNGVPFLGMSSGNRQGDRTRIGGQIRQLRERKQMQAKDLAQLAGIDAANLSRIEQGKYSVGLDILSRIAFVLGAHLELVPNQLFDQQ